MYEAAAYSQNLFKVMLDPATWVVAAILIFAVRRWSILVRVVLAMAINGAFIIACLVWPAGESGRSYAWTAFVYELIATACWCAVFIGCRRLFGMRAT